MFYLRYKKRGKRRGEGAEGCGKGRDSREGCVKRVCAWPPPRRARRVEAWRRSEGGGGVLPFPRCRRGRLARAGRWRGRRRHTWAVVVCERGGPMEQGCGPKDSRGLWRFEGGGQVKGSVRYVLYCARTAVSGESAPRRKHTHHQKHPTDDPSPNTRKTPIYSRGDSDEGC